MKSMYGNLQSCVKIGNRLTPLFDCTAGTKQGCIGSPKLFNIFINDLIKFLKDKSGHEIFVSNEIDDLNDLLFADDVSSFSDTIIQLQRQINLIKQFINGVGLDINIDKTKIILFRNGGNLNRTERWLYDSRNIEVISYYKYLGVYFTSSLSWSKTHNMLSVQATKAMYQILNVVDHHYVLFIYQLVSNTGSILFVWIIYVIQNDVIICFIS